MAPIAFITGASRGIGRATALALADAGFDVVVTARTRTSADRHDYSTTRAQAGPTSLPGSLEETAAAIREKGRRALVLRLDLLEPETIDAAVAQALEAWGRIDLLVNNAIFQGPGLMDRFLDLEEEDARRVFEGNWFSQLRITRRVVPAMLERGEGVVVNVTSAAGISDPRKPTGDGGWGLAYGASKGAFHRIAGVLQTELGGQGLRVYNVEPGYVTTESQKIQFQDDNPLARTYQGAPPEVPAAVITWLATDPEAPALAGQTISAQPFCKERGLLPGWP